MSTYRVEATALYAIGSWSWFCILYYSFDERSSCNISTAQDTLLLFPITIGVAMFSTACMAVRLLRWLTK